MRTWKTRSTFAVPSAHHMPHIYIRCTLITPSTWGGGWGGGRFTRLHLVSAAIFPDSSTWGPDSMQARNHDQRDTDKIDGHFCTLSLTGKTDGQRWTWSRDPCLFCVIAAPRQTFFFLSSRDHERDQRIEYIEKHLRETVRFGKKYDSRKYSI